MLRDERLYRIAGNPRRTSTHVKWLIAAAIGMAALIMAGLAAG